MNKRNPLHPGVEKWRCDLKKFNDSLKGDNLPVNWKEQLDIQMDRLRQLDVKLHERPLKYSDLYAIGIATHFYKTMFDQLKEHDESRAYTQLQEETALSRLPYHDISIEEKRKILIDAYKSYILENKDYIIQDLAKLIEKAVEDRTKNRKANCTPIDYAQAYIRLICTMQRNTDVMPKKALTELLQQRINYYNARFILWKAFLNRENPYSIIDFTYEPLTKGICGLYPCVIYVYLLFDKICKLNVLKTLASGSIKPDEAISDIVDRLKQNLNIEPDDAKSRSYKYLLDLKDYVSKNAKDFYEDILKEIYELDCIKKKIYKVIPKGKLNTEGYNKRLVFNIIGLLCDHNILTPKKSSLGAKLNNGNKVDFQNYVCQEEGDNAQLTVNDVWDIEEVLKLQTGKSFTVIRSTKPNKDGVCKHRLKGPEDINNDLKKIGEEKRNIKRFVL